jgi:prepilin-type N-terminal cleavage/methylation domain-containing protein
MIGDEIIKDNKGVTLLELIVAVAIFSVIMLSATSIFNLVVQSQANAIAAQNMQENMRYVLEVFSKEIRTARKANNDCDAEVGETAVNKVYNTNAAKDILFFKNKDDECVKYYIPSGEDRIKVYRGGVIDDYITPNEISISNLKFEVTDDAVGEFHTTQPKVTIIMYIEAKGKEINKHKTRLQTTISSRYYE